MQSRPETVRDNYSKRKKELEGEQRKDRLEGGAAGDRLRSVSVINEKWCGDAR